MAYANDGADGERCAQPGDLEWGGCVQPAGDGSGRISCGVVGQRRPADRAHHEPERERHGDPAGEHAPAPGPGPDEHEPAPDETGEQVNVGLVRSRDCRTHRHGWAGAHRHGDVRPRQRPVRRERPPRRWC